jgi:putative DNA primase/helicase
VGRDANLWGLLIGSPGVLKSPAIAEALKLLYRADAAAAEEYLALKPDYEIDLAIYEKKRKDAIAKGERPTDPAPKEPRRISYFTNDTSLEALCVLMRDNERGVLFHADEIVAFLQYLDRPENSKMKDFYLKAWAGKEAHNADRIGRGFIPVKVACLSFLGTAQPGTIPEYTRRAVTGAGDNGMIQRFGLMVWPDISPQWVDVDRASLREPVVWEIFKRLDQATPQQLGASQDDRVPYLRFEPDARAMFAEWHAALENRLRGDGLSPAMLTHLSKYRGLPARLALIIHLIDVGSGPVGKKAVARALAWAEYLEAHAWRAYGAGSEPGRAAARNILAKIRAGALKSPFAAWQIKQNDWSGLTDMTHIKLGLEVLCSHHWLAETVHETGGRPKTEYTVNPRVKP